MRFSIEFHAFICENPIWLIDRLDGTIDFFRFMLDSLSGFIWQMASTIQSVTKSMWAVADINQSHLVQFCLQRKICQITKLWHIYFCFIWNNSQKL